ncbi:MAG: Gfo/Idh/MocA family oxidoreductase [Clostridia bacterium]|nr:Gfo/Idh/MocA family oxidoreductase [Clostridia bacterium]MBR6702732.1 Gfo/Idh/MocA family oxidoreductase [Clostridia bacterium]
MEKFRWAYVGSGSIANNTARSITKGDHEITAVCSRNAGKARDFAGKYGAQAFSSFDEMLVKGEFDAVYIATPHTSHAEYSIKAMKAGRPVLCEKPAGVSEKEVGEMIAASEENNVYFCEAMWTWFSPVALEVKKWIDEKRIGDIRNVKIDYAFPGVMMSKNSRLLMPSTAGGALLDIGVYPITYCYNLFGFPERISCRGRLKNGIDTGEKVTLGYAGFDCVLNMSLTRLRESCKITGTKGEITVPVFHMAALASLRSESGKETFTGRTDYLTEFSCAAAEIREGRTQSLYIPRKSTLDCMRIMDECRKQMGLVYPFEEKES